MTGTPGEALDTDEAMWALDAANALADADLDGARANRWTRLPADCGWTVRDGLVVRP